jgi:hypothetical protein
VKISKHHKKELLTWKLSLAGLLLVHWPLNLQIDTFTMPNHAPAAVTLPGLHAAKSSQTRCAEGADAPAAVRLAHTARALQAARDGSSRAL